MEIKSDNYHDYVIKDGKFIGAFEQMYQNIDDPWHHGDATAIQYDMALHLIIRHSICSEGGIVFDIGCGKGVFTARLKQHLPKAQILAIDIAATAIEKARQKYGHMGIDFRVMNIGKEYKNINAKFDLIIMSEVMWYILPDFGTIFNHLAGEILKDDGYFLTIQTFYKPEEQKYGKEIVSTVEDMLSLTRLEVLDMIETNRLTNYDAIVLFRKSQNIK